MCFKWLIYCDCCNDFIYMHTFKHCCDEKCTVVKNDILLQSYCDLCIENGCRSTKVKCVEKKLTLKYETLKTDQELNYNRGANIRQHKL
jgi:hypothetical protein